jgi:hypothetical protein
MSPGAIPGVEHVGNISQGILCEIEFSVCVKGAVGVGSA